MRQVKNRWLVAAGVAAMALLGLTATAGADWIPEPHGTLIHVNVVSGSESADYDMFIPPGLIVSGHYGWALPAAEMMHSKSNKLLGTITALALGIDADPGVSLGFVVDAGDTDTTFTITSTTVTFAPLGWPLAYASAGVTVTDNDSDGATLTGELDGGHAYQAMYNSTPVVLWAELHGSPVVAGADQTMTVNDRRPGGTGRETIYATVSSIQSQWSFTLSANDSASGTSRFDVIAPEPATLALLGLGGLMMVARRRR